MTTLEIGGRVFELTDETSRLVAADALQEAGFEAEAAALRAGTPVVPLLNGRFAVLDAGRLEQELRRLGVATTRNNPGGVSVYFDGHLPAGLVRVSDGTGTVYGDPEAFADSLAELEDDAGFDAVWDALGVTGTQHDYQFVYDYYADHLHDRFRSEQVGEGGTNDNPLAVYTVASNGGIGYLAGPDGVSESAVLEWYRYQNVLAPTRDEAIEWSGGSGGSGFDGWSVSVGFLDGNLGGDEEAARAGVYAEHVEALLREQFPGAEVTVLHQNASGSPPFNYRPTVIDAEGNDRSGEYDRAILQTCDDVFHGGTWMAEEEGGGE